MKLFSTTRRLPQGGYLWIVCLMMLIGSSWGAEPQVVPAKSEPPADAPQAKPDLSAPSPAPIVSDILRLRKQFGDPLKGTLLENPATEPKVPLKQPQANPKDTEAGSDQSFTEALRRVRQTTASNPVKSVTPEPLPVGTPSPVVLEQRGPTLNPLQQSLRESWRLLEQRAAELEDLADYQQADQLRKLSRKIRLQSRQLANPGTATRLSKPR